MNDRKSKLSLSDLERHLWEGYPRFSIYYHTLLWKSLDAKNPANGYGTVVAGKNWLWYERWIDAVREHCRKNREQYS